MTQDDNNDQAGGSTYPPAPALTATAEVMLAARSGVAAQERHAGPGTRARILIIENHALLRAGLRALLELESDLEVVAEAAGAADAVRIAESCQPELVIMDVSLTDGCGLNTIPMLRAACPGARILVLTAQVSNEYIRTALHFGAEGYVLKDAHRAELMLAVRTVLAGSKYLSPAVSAKVVSGYLQRKQAPQVNGLFGVTRREREILVLVARGTLSKEIAAQLGVSVKTVEKHRSNFMRKLSLRSPAAVTMFAIRHGLLPAGG